MVRYCVVVVVLFGFWCQSLHNESSKFNHSNAVNALIGDRGYYAKHGKLPDADIPENEKISAHLAYVEKTLRTRSVKHLSKNQQLSRASLLNHLRDYRQAGVFPTNYDCDERRPCFIDHNGNICAVGYLVEKSVGRQVAEGINERFQYAYLWEMEDENLSHWQSQSGFTLRELAMIQPTYPPTVYILRLDGATPCTSDFEDFIAFAQAFGSKKGDTNFNARADFNSDDVINFPDFISFAGAFGNMALPAQCERIHNPPPTSYNVLGQLLLSHLSLNLFPDGVVHVIGDTVRSFKANGFGNYNAYNLLPGNYLFVPRRLGYVFTPDTLAVTVVNDHVFGVDFQAQKIFFVVAGQILADGVGVSDVQVTLEANDTQTVKTDDNGHYVFPGYFFAGDYTLTPFLEGFEFVPPKVSYLVDHWNVDTLRTNFMVIPKSEE